MVATLLLPPTVETERMEMESLAASCAHRRLIHELVVADLDRWTRLTLKERRVALVRARRRVDAVVPHPVLDFGA